MKTIELNIGLDTNDGGKIALHTAILVTNNRFNIIKSRLDVSPNGGEQTLVCVVEYAPEFVDRLHEICGLLKQDCIAAIWPNNGELIGELIGPNAAKWGQFNPEFFIPFDAPETLKNDDAEEFIGYLEGTLIPDLEESGHEATAEYFATLIDFYRLK